MKKIVPMVLTLLLFLMTIPRFFDIYRTMAFKTIPHDDYATYLLHFLGEDSYFTIAYSPYGYRVLSYLAAVPFYKLLPVYRFTNLPPIDENYLGAFQALAMSSYLASLGACLMIYLTAKKRLRLSVPISLLAAFMAYVLFGFTNMPAVDPMAIFLISLLIYFIEQPVPFAAIVLLSVAFNEKVSLVLGMLLLARLAFQRKAFQERWQLLFTLLAMASYFLIRTVVGLPGFEHQTSLGSFLPSFMYTLQDTLSLKGIIQNLLPILILLLLYFFALQSLKYKKTAYFYWSDILVLAGLALLAFVTRLEYTVGRIVMYSFPLYLPAACASIGIFFAAAPEESKGVES